MGELYFNKTAKKKKNFKEEYTARVRDWRKSSSPSQNLVPSPEATISCFSF